MRHWIGFWHTLVVCVAVCGGCTSTKHVRFESTPRGASVQIESQKKGFAAETTTPGTVALPNRGVYFATYSLEGYHTETTLVAKAARNKDQAVVAVGAGVGTAGVVAPSLPALWNSAVFVGGAMPVAVGFMAIAPVGIAAYGIHRAWPVLPEEVHVLLTPEDEPAPENAGDMAYWRTKLEEEAAFKKAAREEGRRARGAPGRGYRR